MTAGPGHGLQDPTAVQRGWMLGLFTVIYTFGFIDRMVVAVLGQPIKADLGLTDLQLGLMGGLTFAVFNAVLSIPVARLAERFNRVAIVAAGVAVWSAATMACGMAGSFVHLLLGRLGVGVGEAVVPAVNSVISDYYPREKRASALSVYMLAVPIGAFAGAALGGLVAQHWGWRVAFLVAGAPGLLLAVLLRLTVREPRRGRYDPPAGAGEAAPPLSAVFKRMLQRPAQLNFIAGSALASAAGYGINFFLAPYFARRFGLDYTLAGFLAGLISALPGVFSILAGGMLTDRAARRDVRWYAWLPGIGVLLACPLYVISLVQGGWLAATAVLMITGLVQYAYIPASAAVTQNLMQPRMRASAAAIYGLITNLVGLGVGPLLVGALSDVFARRAFAGLDYDIACAGAAATQGACGAASAAGLQGAMISVSVLYLWAAAHYFIAARTLKADMDRL